MERTETISVGNFYKPNDTFKNVFKPCQIIGIKFRNPLQLNEYTLTDLQSVIEVKEPDGFVNHYLADTFFNCFNMDFSNGTEI